MRRLSHVLLALTVSAGPAAAQSAQEQADAAYKVGLAAFRAEDFPAALTAFERAYKLDPSPVLIYNLARTYEEMGRAEEAIEHFELYLARQPDATDREDVETRIRVTRKLLERRQPADEPPVPAPASAVAEAPPRPEPDDDWRRPVAYGALATGALAAGLAALFYTRASDAADAADGLRGEPDARRGLEDDFERGRLGMWLSAGSAVVLVGLGATLLLTGPDTPAPTATRGGAVFTW